MRNKSQRSQEKVSSIDCAIAAFAAGFSFTRGFTHPYLAEKVEGIWVLRDTPRKKNDYRSEEWIALGIGPVEMDRIARANTRGRFAVCAILGIGEADGPVRDGFKELGYRLRGTEPLMVHNLRKIPAFNSPAQIERVTTQEMADQLAKAAKARQILPGHLTGNAPLRQYVAVLEGKMVGWVRSIVAGDATWCSNMHVLPEYRRRGIARAMLGRMLKDDRANGSTLAALLASHTGAKLYPVVGYVRIGTLYLFSPRKR